MKDDEKLTMLLMGVRGDIGGPEPVIEMIVENERPIATVPANMTVIEALNEFMRQQKNKELEEEIIHIVSNNKWYHVVTRGIGVFSKPVVLEPKSKLAEYMQYTIEDSGLGNVLPFWLEYVHQCQMGNPLIEKIRGEKR